MLTSKLTKCLPYNLLYIKPLLVKVNRSTFYWDVVKVLNRNLKLMEIDNLKFHLFLFAVVSFYVRLRQLEKVKNSKRRKGLKSGFPDNLMQQSYFRNFPRPLRRPENSRITFPTANKPCEILP